MTGFFHKPLMREVGGQSVAVRTITLRDLAEFQGPAEILAPMIFLAEYQAALITHQAEARALVLAASDASPDLLDGATIAEICALLQAVGEANADFFDRLVGQMIGLPRKIAALNAADPTSRASSQGWPGQDSDTPAVLT